MPLGISYCEAVQNPDINLKDSELKTCNCQIDDAEMPVAYSGGFTTTFRFINRSSSREWAVRCFRRNVQDLAIRYDAIGKFIQSGTHHFLVQTNYQEEGVLISGQWYPIIKMEWIKGEALNSYVKKHLASTEKIIALIEKFIQLINKMESLGIAHGDLQHGNIIVKNDDLFLIDYDGFFLPGLSNLSCNEIGHRNYQHPERNENHNGPLLDRFSAIVIYTGLLALSKCPQLWEKYEDGENILFLSSDYKNIEASPLFLDLMKIQDFSQIVDRFRGVCKLGFDALPRLDDFINGNFSYRDVVATVPPAQISRNQYVLIEANDLNTLRSFVGIRVEIVGQIEDIYLKNPRKIKQLLPFVFLNFGSHPDQTLTLVIWGKALYSEFELNNIDPKDYVGKWVKVNGVLGSYRGTPQISIENSHQIQILTDKSHADRLLLNRTII
jgi:serine/threonine protein kinase